MDFKWFPYRNYAKLLKRESVLSIQSLLKLCFLNQRILSKHNRESELTLLWCWTMLFLPLLTWTLRKKLWSEPCDGCTGISPQTQDMKCKIFSLLFKVVWIWDLESNALSIWLSLMQMGMRLEGFLVERPRKTLSKWLAFVVRICLRTNQGI